MIIPTPLKGGVLIFSFEFVNQMQSYVKTYKNFPLPAILCDTDFRVFWSNLSAKKIAPQATKKLGLQELLEEYNQDEIHQSLQDDGSYRIGDFLPFTNMSLSLSPLYFDNYIVGTLALILPPEESFLPMDTLSKSRQALTEQMRQSLHQIFSVTETASIKADLLDSNWIDPHLGKINFSSYNMLRVTNNISAYSRLQNGLIQFEYSAIPLVKWFHDIKDPLSALAKENSIPVYFHLPDDEIIVTIDVNYFQLVFFNILHNSIYFTKDNNEIHIYLSQEKDFIRIIVRDHGIGMTPEVLKQAFVPFYSHILDSYGQNVGLGLTLARRLVELHDGSISLHSDDGDTSVELTFPVSSFTQQITFSQNQKTENILDRFSHLYVGLTSALESPYKK